MRLDLGADGDVYLEEFVTEEPVNIGKFPKDVQSKINKGIAKVGMTKEQVYLAMGAPVHSLIRPNRKDDL